MAIKKQPVAGPVPFERHYEIFKGVEDMLKDYLSEQAHEYYVAGLRVAYDLEDSPNEPDVFPYSIEFGYLGAVDSVIQCGEPEEIGDADLKILTKYSAVSVDLLDQLYEFARDALEEAALANLTVGIFMVVTGSPHQGYSVSCACRRRTRRKYCVYNKKTGRTRCYCTRRRCRRRK